MPDALNPSVTFANAPRPPSGSPGGAAGEQQLRLAPHSYDGGGGALAGSERPNPRAISNTVFQQTDARGAPADMPNAGGFSSLLWVWGQFLDHDLVQTRNGPQFGAAPIRVPGGDPVFPDGATLDFSRSAPLAGTGTGAANPRQFANATTAFIDGSSIYGSDAARLAALREPGSAKLRLTQEGTIGFASGDPIFGGGPITGDARAGENIALLSMHALFAREHNRVVDELRAAAPQLGAAELFQGARARVEAVIQAITFNEFLPILVGEGAFAPYRGFRPNVDPGIALEFSTAVYRLGHTLLSPTIARMNESGGTHPAGDIALRDAFNRRGLVEQTGLEAIFRGMATTSSQEFDTYMIEDVRSLLFGAGGPGSDLAALNIQRGRDHGLPTYNGMREALGLAPKTRFSQITEDAEVAARLSEAYRGDISRLDLWVGGLAEDSVRGGLMGETFRAVMIDQFTRLRDGDAFWSEGRGFGARERAALWSTTLSDVILRNSDVRDLQDNAFLAYARMAGGAGDDRITGGPGRNLIIGNAGDDLLTGGRSADHIVGGAGDDRLRGLGGPDRLEGGRGADRLDGGPGTDIVNGGPGRDVIIIRGAEAARDRMNGGAGADTIRVDPSGGDVTVAGTQRIASVETFAGAGRAVLGTEAADRLDFSVFDTVTGVRAIRGYAGDDVITGTRGADRLLGGAGDDRLDGGRGGDALFGGRGDDLLSGGRGEDKLSGGAGRDRLLGGPGADRLFGGRGDDLLDGGRGDDILRGGPGDDVFRFVAGGGAGRGTIRDFDAAGDDVIRLVGFSYGAPDPDALGQRAKLIAVAGATRFDAEGAEINLNALGGSGRIRLDGVTDLSFTGSEDFILG